ncbi:MAG: DinB family protein, partial [Phycisphaerae bacterium]
MHAMSIYGALWAHNDWGRDKVMALAANLDDGALDRSFAMGAGTLRLTLQHLWRAERAWLDCWLGDADPPAPPAEPALPVPALWDRFRLTAAERDRFLQGTSPQGLARKVRYRDSRGRAFEHALGDMMLHVCNHGQHHRAQALNMLRHLGIEKIPGLDYLFMRVEQPESTPDSDPAVIERYFEYDDWAMQRVLAVAEALDNAQLDQPFEMGVGSLRTTLTHIHDAQRWWLENWTTGTSNAFRESPADTSMGELSALWRKTVEERNAFLSRQSAEGLSVKVTAQVSPTQRMTFALGDTVMFVPGHGT